MLPKAGVYRQTMKWSGLPNASAVECREAMNANREDCVKARAAARCQGREGEVNCIGKNEWDSLRDSEWWQGR